MESIKAKAVKNMCIYAVGCHGFRHSGGNMSMIDVAFISTSSMQCQKDAQVMAQSAHCTAQAIITRLQKNIKVSKQRISDHNSYYIRFG